MAGFDPAPLVAQARALAAQYRAGFDNYQVVRATSTSDGAGGATTVEAVVENGYAILTAGATRPVEQVVAAEAGSSAPYVLRNLPYNTLLTASDVVTVGARRFEVLGVLRAAAVNVAVTAVLEERT